MGFCVVVFVLCGRAGGTRYQQCVRTHSKLIKGFDLPENTQSYIFIYVCVCFKNFTRVGVCFLGGVGCVLVCEIALELCVW